MSETEPVSGDGDPPSNTGGTVYYFKTTGTSTGLGVAILAAIILFAFYIWLTYASADSLIIEQKTRNLTSTIFCPPGQCAMDILTGEKICPEGDEQYSYNPVTQICMNPTTCSGSMPYAIQPDGSTNSLGACSRDPLTGELLECRCSQQSTCADYITTVFQSISGNPFTALEGTRTLFTQSARADYGGSVGLNLSNNIQFADPNNTFCQVPITWVFRSNPGCTNYGSGDIADNAYECINSNPCLIGTLAYISDDSSTFSSSDILSKPVACVSASRIDGVTDPCTNAYPVYDTRYGGINCVPNV